MNNKEIDFDMENKIRKLKKTSKNGIESPEGIKSLDEIVKEKKRFIPQRSPVNILMFSILSLLFGIFIAYTLNLFGMAQCDDFSNINATVRIIYSIGFVSIIPLNNIYWSMGAIGLSGGLSVHLVDLNGLIIKNAIYHNEILYDYFFLLLGVVYILILILNIVFLGIRIKNYN